MTHKPAPHFVRRFVFAFTGFLGAVAFPLSAAVPPPEKLLPEDTLLVLTAPDFGKVREIYKNNPQSQLWNDPALKPFKENFLSKWKEEITGPLERELDIRLDDYTSLPQGQVTFALIQNGWQGRENESLGKLLLLDTRDKSAQLKSNLAALRRKWVDSGKSLRTEKIRDVEFFVLPLSSNDVPKTIRQFFPQKPEVQELGEDNAPVKKPAPKSELVIGQAGSLLIVADTTKAAEKVAARVNGGSLPSLADVAAFQGSQASQFRDAPIFGWVNIKTFFDIISRAPDEPKNSEAAPDPFATMKPEKLFGAMGVSGLRTLSFTARQSADGLSLQLFLSAPESGRSGLFKVIAGEPKESSTPPFVPADAVKFRRWRLDGQKLWASLEKMLADLSPQMANTLNFLLDMANANAKEKDPGFDVRKNLIGNLGDDIISYEKAARGSSAEESKAGPSIFLLGSPNPDQFVAALRSILGFGAAQAGAPSEREFLGRKIFSAPLPNLPIPGASAPRPGKPSTFHYAATSGYVAMTTDAALLEEFLRSSDSQAKRLRETPGLVEASQKVMGPGTGLFGFENQAETMRTFFETLRNDSSTNSVSSFGAVHAAFGTPDKSIKDLMDFSLLPPYEKISKYFHFTVYALSATSEGLTFKVFAPVPPSMKAGR